MAKEIRLGAEAISAALASATVRSALRARANRALPRVKRTAYEAGATNLGDELRVEEGTRPGTKAEGGVRRPYARVVAELTDEQARADSRATLTRLQIIRRGSRA